MNKVSSIWASFNCVRIAPLLPPSPSSHRVLRDPSSLIRIPTLVLTARPANIIPHICHLREADAILAFAGLRTILRIRDSGRSSSTHGFCVVECRKCVRVRKAGSIGQVG